MGKEVWRFRVNHPAPCFLDFWPRMGWGGTRTWQDTLHPALEHQWTCVTLGAVQGLCFNTWKPTVGAWNGLAGGLRQEMFVLSRQEGCPSSVSRESLWGMFPGWGVFWGTSANENYVFVWSINVHVGLQLRCGCDNSYLNAASEVFVADTHHPLRADCCCLAWCYSACVTNALLAVASLLFL